jgi:hypothetical protein
MTGMRIAGGGAGAEAVRITTPAYYRLTEELRAEKDLQADGEAAFARLIRPPAEWTAFPAGHLKLTGAQAARLTRIGLRRSWPDHLVLHAGKLIGIEWKKRGETLSRSRWVRTKSGKSRWVEGQREVFPRLAEQGMRGPYVCETVEQALEALEAEGVPMVRWRIAA